MRFIVAIFVLGLVGAGPVADMRGARASERCLYGPCGAHERLFGPTPGSRDVTKRGYRSWNDIYNERNQGRYQSGIKAQPFDEGLTGAETGTLNDDHPEARSEHVRWCLKRYRSYAVKSNTYVTYGGHTRYCDSPFN
jgi:hypothetical protein